MLVSFDETDRRAIQESLQLHKTTLESLWIRPNEEFEGDYCGIGPLTQFTRLKCLHVGLPDLLGEDADIMRVAEWKDILPPSLENLYICGCEPYNLSWAPKRLEDMIVRGLAPNLTYLALE